MATTTAPHVAIGEQRARRADQLIGAFQRSLNQVVFVIVPGTNLRSPMCPDLIILVLWCAFNLGPLADCDVFEKRSPGGPVDRLLGH
jgi:hypothetical protein